MIIEYLHHSTSQIGRGSCHQYSFTHCNTPSETGASQAVSHREMNTCHQCNEDTSQWRKGPIPLLSAGLTATFPLSQDCVCDVMRVCVSHIFRSSHQRRAVHTPRLPEKTTSHHMRDDGEMKSCLLSPGSRYSLMSIVRTV